MYVLFRLFTFVTNWVPYVRYLRGLTLFYVFYKMPDGCYTFAAYVCYGTPYVCYPSVALRLLYVCYVCYMFVTESSLTDYWFAVRRPHGVRLTQTKNHEIIQNSCVIPFVLKDLRGEYRVLRWAGGGANILSVLSYSMSKQSSPRGIQNSLSELVFYTFVTKHLTFVIRLLRNALRLLSLEGLRL